MAEYRLWERTLRDDLLQRFLMTVGLYILGIVAVKYALASNNPLYETLAAAPFIFGLLTGMMFWDKWGIWRERREHWTAVLLQRRMRGE